MISLLAVAFLFACGGSCQPPTLKIIQAEHTLSATTTDTVSERSEITNMENKTVPESIENDLIHDDDRPRNTKWADADSNPRWGHFDVYGKQHTHNYFLMDVKPLYNGKNITEEISKYVSENNKFKEIAEENNIQEADISIEIFINTDGTIDVKIREECDAHQALTDEMLRLINSMQDHGKWTPGKHDGEVMRARIAAYGYRF